MLTQAAQLVIIFLLANRHQTLITNELANDPVQSNSVSKPEETSVPRVSKNENVPLSGSQENENSGQDNPNSSAQETKPGHDASATSDSSKLDCCHVIFRMFSVFMCVCVCVFVFFCCFFLFCFLHFHIVAVVSF